METPGSQLAIRGARSSEAGRIATIWFDGWRDGHLGFVPDALVAARTEASFLRRAVDRVDGTTVLTVDEVIAGFVMVVGDEVEQVYVDSGFRGTGAARALLAEAERQVGDGGHETAWLAVVAGNARARRFYERQGWTDGGLFEYGAANEAGAKTNAIAVPCHRYEKRIR